VSRLQAGDKSPAASGRAPLLAAIAARDDLDALLATRASAGQVLATAFSVLAPLMASVASALL
jgi:hypothetical protein